MNCFHYRWSKLLPIDLVVFVLAGVMILGIIGIERGDPNSIFFILGIYAFLIPLYLNARLMKSRVCVDAEGAKWSCFGFTWKVIRWEAVARIRRLRSYDMSEGREINTYSIDLLPKPTVYFLPKGSIVFNETIERYDELLALINTYAREHRINLVAMVANHQYEPLSRL